MKTRPFFVATIIATFVAISTAFVWNSSTPTPNMDTVAFESLKLRFIQSKRPYFEVSEDIFLDRKKADSTVWVHQNNTSIDYEFRDFLPYLTKTPVFSRMPLYFLPVQMLENDKYVVFIYRQTRGFSDIAYDRFYVSVLDKQGNAVHHEDITEGREHDEVVAFKIDSELNLKKRIFIRKRIEDNDATQTNSYTLAFKSKQIIDLKTIKPVVIQEEDGFLQKIKLPKKKTQPSANTDRAK